MNPFPQEKTLKKLNVTRLATVVGALASLAGYAIVPSDPPVLSQMSGSYSVVDQLFNPASHGYQRRDERISLKDRLPIVGEGTWITV